jgi:hypothetical protein
LIRIKDLTWSHHRIVAHLGPQKQRELLEFAHKNRIRVRAFQAHVSAKFPPKRANPPEPAEELEDDSFDPNQHWDDMPECDNDDLTPFQAVIVNFANREDRKAFEKLVGQKITDSTRSIWFPEAEDAPYKGTQYVAVEPEPEEVAV